MYDNEKQYTAMPSETSIEWMHVITELQEIVAKEDTGFINSLLGIKTTTQSWTDLKELATSNAKQLQINLLQYKSISAVSKKVKCGDLQYSWYLMTFSYEIDKLPLYEWQYFLLDDDNLYLLALSSDDKKDITSFIKSVETITCSK